ncbi:uroporphyrinogen-III C-methyltransferase [Ideonella azotifigens]|uniref:uroporphyrinogen-III C-methyltransferase n=1 Tax=Ideonella azotifigens TaxID=513160 RepID=A0ABP3VL21_9BURK|nr:uroporphyrinogen-III C-methyltransferase [Ideonella azotifigens]MCD2338738.1 uroporphyrinogen-III C-methyltransferase [Ideonella azotifigens]
MTASPTIHPVHLVGAGPGDPELLTLKAVRVLREATVILIDDLVGERVLDEVLDGSAQARPRVVHVGKRGGCASTPQAFIEKLLVREALAGEKVVRLKGGDPLVFGRAGEEITALREAGVPVIVVNGITAGLAAVNALGTGWTDRRHAQGVMLVTGHAQSGGTGADWAAIGAAAATGLTLVIYMGVTQAPRLVEQLLPALGADYPAAVVQHASTASQRCALTTLGELVATIDREGLGSPAVLVLGRVLEAAAVQALQPWVDQAAAG